PRGSAARTRMLASYLWLLRRSARSSSTSTYLEISSRRSSTARSMRDAAFRDWSSARWRSIWTISERNHERTIHGEAVSVLQCRRAMAPVPRAPGPSPPHRPRGVRRPPGGGGRGDGPGGGRKVRGRQNLPHPQAKTVEDAVDLASRIGLEYLVWDEAYGRHAV